MRLTHRSPMMCLFAFLLLANSTSHGDFLGNCYDHKELTSSHLDIETLLRLNEDTFSI